MKSFVHQLKRVNIGLNGLKVMILSMTKNTQDSQKKFKDAELQELLDKNSAQFTSKLN